MKPLVILTRIMSVGLFWSVFFIEGVRVIMLRNWHFDMFQTAHWQHAWNLWLSGWVINTPKEWAFVLIILTFIPLWLSGWAALSMIRWEKVVLKALRLPWTALKRCFFRPVKIIAHSAAPGKGIKKKKSYKEVRPRSLRIPLDDRAEPPLNASKLITPTQKVKPLMPAIAAAGAPLQGTVKPTLPPSPTPPAPQDGAAFTHSLFNMDGEDDDFDFNIDDFDLDKAAKPEKKEEASTAPAPSRFPEPKAPAVSTRQPRRDKDRRGGGPAQTGSKNGNGSQPQNNGKKSGSGNSVLDVIRQHGYETINGATIRNTLVDFIGIAKEKIVLCLVDKEPGDWLADEERFNDEEPLWFSESSHRISPVRKIDLARKVLREKFQAAGIAAEVKAYVIISIGNIINAEDMFEIWDGLNVKVTRIDRGTPKEICLFAKELEDAGGAAERDAFERIKKLIRNIA